MTIDSDPIIPGALRIRPTERKKVIQVIVTQLKATIMDGVDSIQPNDQEAM